MLPAVRRYKSTLSSVLVRRLPCTTAYLQAEHEARKALLQLVKARSRKSTMKAPTRAADKPVEDAIREASRKPVAASWRAP